ncbi:MAG: hypothetical protein N4J56_004496 [Chroococcidiopsis sp. SAG 2025]|uniref:hypothetical protein n=1 Tax=Chroococcidiopsis sp. SAG 2025 TaxID=171389 RepID=UPI002936E58D|nr:hypothetical protein [Chroococcidiopsis sp. SAG 2025]MDV2994842.1 hypothetical protein [Chroococcidiopsis sp. SAG 2025]
MLPLVGVPKTIATSMSAYREVFCREEGFEHISRYLSGLLLSENKTLQGIHAQQVYASGEAASRRAMHAAVFEAGWDSERLMARHRELMGKQHQGKGREVISLDWTLSHHEFGAEIFGVKRAYDYVNHCMSRYQTVVTAVIANPQQIDGVAVEVQLPDYSEAERAYLKMTAQPSYEQMEQLMQRLIELLHHQKNQLAYRKRTEIVVDIVRQVEAQGQFPKADYAFDNGVLTLELTQLIESSGKHWVSEIECSRLIQWHRQWQRVDTVATQLRTEHPQSFRSLNVRCRNGEQKQFLVFTKVVRLKRYGRKRLVIVHEQEDLSDAPRFLLTDALHWESARVIQTWSYPWSCEIFHEFCKQVTGFESAQVRNEEAVKRHFRLSCVAQSLLGQAACQGKKSEQFAFANGKQTVGQQLYSLTREAYHQLLLLVQGLFAQGRTCEQVLEVIMPV